VTGKRPHVVVTAAIVERADTVLITRRPRGVHLEGLWEFPGGKCEPGESHQTCLQREIQEELGTDVRVLDEIFQVAHAYDDRVVELHFFRCELLGKPHPLLGQEMRWVPLASLDDLAFPPADAELIEVLKKNSGG
jgi:mutator protein MutT